MGWKNIRLNGASAIARICSVYELAEHRLPGGKFKIKVLEREQDFIALPNVCIRSESGVPEWTCGIGGSETEALQDAIEYIMADLGTKQDWLEDELEWSDPRDF